MLDYIDIAKVVVDIVNWCISNSGRDCSDNPIAFLTIHGGHVAYQG